MNNRKVKIIIIVILCTIVSILSIGYAVLSSKLKISGTATIPGAKCDAAFVASEKRVEKTGSAKCEFGDIAKTSITGLKATFTKPGDSCTFTIPAKNDGSMVNYLSDVINKDATLTFTGSGESSKDDEELLKRYVTYEVKYDDTVIDANTSFNTIGTLESGQTKTVTLKIEFSYEATEIPKNAVIIGGLDRTFVYNCGKLNSVGDFSPQCEDGTLLTPTPVSTPNAPVLNGDMIPVYYEETSTTEGVWKKADENNTNNEWYDYNKQKWANAVTVTSASRENYKKATPGTIINDTDINTMWVWIPRYSYTIKSEDGGNNYYGKRISCDDTLSLALPGEIDVKFVDKDTTEEGDAQYTGDVATNWRTNEAFNFGGTSHVGLWVGKFEVTGSVNGERQACVDVNCDVSNITIKPGISALREQTISSLFYAARSMQNNNYNTFGFDKNKGDLHMIKNDEWGAVAYLSQSKYGKYGNSDYSGLYKEVYQNKSKDYITGSSNGTPSQNEYKDGEQYSYNNMTKLGNGKGLAGPGASTSGTIYGVYDMSGGDYEHIMGVLASPVDGTPIVGFFGSNGDGGTGFNGKIFNTYDKTLTDRKTNVMLPDEKYYNLYHFDISVADIPSLYRRQDLLKIACNGKVCYGHALSENSGFWGSAVEMVSESPWFCRGGSYANDFAGVYSSTPGAGVCGFNYVTTHFVLSS